MHWAERIVLCFCRFIFPKYHKCIIASRKTCLRHFCTFLFTLFGFITLLAQLIPFHHLLHAVRRLSCYRLVNLHVLIRKPIHLTKIIYRTLLFIFWASLVRSYLLYIVRRHSTYEDIPLGLGVLLGVHFTRFLDQISCLETPTAPIYLPISICFADIGLLLQVQLDPWSIEDERLAVNLLQTHSIAGSWFIQDFFVQALFLRIFLTLLFLSLFGFASALCPDPARSLEWQRTSGVQP